MGLVGRISGEQLVPAVARERDGRRAAREAREQVGGEERRVAERLVEELGQTRDEVEGRARIKDLFLMVGVEDASDATCVRGFVERGVLEADRERLEAAGEVPRGERGDRARVDATRQEHAERYVTHEVLLHRAVQRGAERLHSLGFVDPRAPLEVDVPVRLELDAAVGIREPVAGRELSDRAEDRMGCRDVLVGEVT